MKKILSLILTLIILSASLVAAASVSADGAGLVLRESCQAELDRSSGYLIKVPSAITVGEIKAYFSGSVSIERKGASLGDLDAVACDDVVSGGGESFKILISGDVNRDAAVDTLDIIQLMKYLAGWDVELSEEAGRVTLGDKVSTDDVILLMKYVAGWNVTVGHYTVSYSNKKISAPYEDNSISLFFDDGMVKKDKNDRSSTGFNSYLMKSAKNEIEFTQMFLVSSGDRKGLSVSLSSFKDSRSNSFRSDILWEYYFKVKDAETYKEVYYADALPPVDEKFSLSKNKSQGFVIKAFPEEDTPAGLYEATVEIKDGAKVIKTAKVYCQVWNFVLSDKTECETAFGMSSYEIYLSHGLYDGDDGVLYKNYYDYLLENRVCAYFLPYELTDSRADEYITNPRVTAFEIDGYNKGGEHYTESEFKEIHDKLSKNQALDKAYFYTVDEPQNMTQINQITEDGRRLAKVFPGYNLVCPYFVNLDLSTGIDQTEYMSETVNILCPLSWAYTPLDTKVSNTRQMFSELAVGKYGTAEERFTRYELDGRKNWWYVCVVPHYPYANLFGNYQGVLTRVLLWQQFDYSIEGILYWSVNYWRSGAEWRDIYNEFECGDGLLIYCGKKYDVYGPIGSLRLELLRDGIEDYQYLCMARELFGQEKADEFVASVTTDIVNYTHDYKVLKSARDTLGDLIENELEKLK